MDEALTLSKSVAGLNAQAKGRRLSIFKPHEEKMAREKTPAQTFVSNRANPLAWTVLAIRT